MFCGSECWTLGTTDVQRLQRNELAMIRWICKVKIRDKSDSLLNKLCLKNLDITLRTNYLRWFGYVCRSDGWIKKYSMKLLVNENAVDLEKLGNSALAAT